MSNQVPRVYTVKWDLDDTDDNAYHVSLTETQKAELTKRFEAAGTKFEFLDHALLRNSYKDFLEVLEDAEIK
jgi:hypothetical protein